MEIGVFPKKVTEIKISFEEGKLKYFISLEGSYYNFDDIGKTVFLTQAEAEQKLKEMNDNYGITE